ncbi:hypothetical protein TNCV_1526931 [Trichonephila clavipes]|nr:hypothetical protein TNCV_1526931 [Trichonephila clavipes]
MNKRCSSWWKTTRKCYGIKLERLSSAEAKTEKLTWAMNSKKNIVMKNGEPVGAYITRARGISTKCHSLGLDVSPRELVYHTVIGLNGKFSKVHDVLKLREKELWMKFFKF